MSQDSTTGPSGKRRVNAKAGEQAADDKESAGPVVPVREHIDLVEHVSEENSGAEADEGSCRVLSSLAVHPSGPSSGDVLGLEAAMTPELPLGEFGYPDSR